MQIIDPIEAKEDREAQMKPAGIQTPRLELRLNTPQHARAQIDAMDPADRAQVSPDWLAQLDASPEPDPWIHGFSLIHRTIGAEIGAGAFKGPPSPDGMVEIAYVVAAEYQSQGYATEAAKALTAFAFNDSRVRVVRAHTLPQPNASTRVLTKCGFQFVGDIADPEDGPVWRWEKQAAPT
jgi:RimJ/RimL family protein N-acetyltransferase